MQVSRWTCNNLLGHVLFAGVEIKLFHDGRQSAGSEPDPDGEGAICWKILVQRN